MAIHWIRLIDVKWILVIEKEVSVRLFIAHGVASLLINTGNVPITRKQWLLEKLRSRQWYPSDG